MNIIIIGGGLIGMLTARSLLRRGYGVTILERGPFGREASWAGGGILSPLYPWRHTAAVNALAFASQRIYPDVVREIEDLTLLPCEYWPCGMLVTDVNDDEYARQWALEHKVRLEMLDRRAIEKLVPGLAGVDTACWMPDVAQVRNPRFIKAMQAYLVEAGARLLPDSEVSAVETSAGAVTGVRTAEGRFFPSARVVIANGAWSGRLLRQMAIDLQVHPVRGQMILLAPERPIPEHMVLKGGRYLIPRRDGRVVVGSTVEEAGFENATTDAARRALHEFAAELMPMLNDATIEEHWSGLRPGCGEGVPYIGEHPDIRGLYINAGHYRNGIVMAPASADLLAALVNDETPEIDPSPYAFDQQRGPVAI